MGKDAIKRLLIIGFLILLLVLVGCNSEESLLQNEPRGQELTEDFVGYVIAEFTKNTNDMADTYTKLIDEEITIGAFLKILSFIEDNSEKLLSEINNIKTSNEQEKEIVLTLKNIIEKDIYFVEHTNERFNIGNIENKEELTLNEFYSKLNEKQKEEYDGALDSFEEAIIESLQQIEYLESLVLLYYPEYSDEAEPSQEYVEQSKYNPPEPITIKGSGSGSGSIFYLEKGLVKFRSSHLGNYNFAITLYDVEGNYIDLVANEIGKYTGEKLVQIPHGGDYYLDVMSDGLWETTITDPNMPAQTTNSKKPVEKKEIIPWEEFFEECKSEYSKSVFYADESLNTDKCEKEYAKEYELPEYCEKISDYQELENCWMGLAIKYNNPDYCDNFKLPSVEKDCEDRAQGFFQI